MSDKNDKKVSRLGQIINKKFVGDACIEHLMKRNWFHLGRGVFFKPNNDDAAVRVEKLRQSKDFCCGVGEDDKEVDEASTEVEDLQMIFISACAVCV